MKTIRQLKDQVKELQEKIDAKVHVAPDSEMETEDEGEDGLSPEQLREIAMAEVRSLEKMLQCDPAADLQQQLQARLDSAKEDGDRKRIRAREGRDPDKVLSDLMMRKQVRIGEICRSVPIGTPRMNETATLKSFINGARSFDRDRAGRRCPFP